MQDSETAPAAPIARAGMNYFDGWSDTLANFHFNGLVRPGAYGRFGRREPLSGWRDDSAAVMNAELERAHSDAIDFFEFDWFYPPPDPTLNTALANYRRLPDHHGVGYSLLYVNIDPFVVPNRYWQTDVDDWAAKDFISPTTLELTVSRWSSSSTRFASTCSGVVQVVSTQRSKRCARRRGNTDYRGSSWSAVS